MDGIQRTNAALLMSGPFKAAKSGNKGTVDFNEATKRLEWVAVKELSLSCHNLDK